MARKRSAARTEEDLLEVQQTPTVPAPRHRAVDGRDPREPLPVGNVEEAAPRLESMSVAESRNQRNLSSKYARNLVANGGDVVLALAATFDIDPDVAAAEMVELHERARGASRANVNIGDMMERHDVTTEVRIAALRSHMFGANAAASLKAADMLNDMDATAKSKRIGTTWESFVQRVRAGAGPRARQEQTTKALK